MTEKSNEYNKVTTTHVPLLVQKSKDCLDVTINKSKRSLYFLDRVGPNNEIHSVPVLMRRTDFTKTTNRSPLTSAKKADMCRCCRHNIYQSTVTVLVMISLVHYRRRLFVEKRQSLQHLSAPPLHHSPTQKFNLGRDSGGGGGGDGSAERSINQSINQ